MLQGNLKCGICEKNLLRFISFGKMPAANAFLKEEQLENHFKEFFYDMEVGFCENCKMVQLVNIVPYDKYIIKDDKGKRNYAFFSSTSNVMEKHFAEIAKEIEEKFLDKNSKVLEIGSNDGIFLKNFKNNEVMGVEPSENVAEIAVQKGIPTITEFFTEELARKILLAKGKFRAVFAANVTLNIIDLHDYIKGVKLLLEDNGVFITEEPYLLDILDKNTYDQIYDEHIWYFSLFSLSNLFSMHEMEIFDAKKEEVHGGSIRVYVCKKNTYKKSEGLKKYLEEENEKNINLINPYLEFARKVEENKNKFINLIRNLKYEGKKIVGYAAASKGTIIQNYCNLDNKMIDYISDSTPYKQGLFSPGKHIPIVSPNKFHEDVNNNKVDYAVIFAWNHAKEIIDKEQEFLRNGKFIVPFPEPRIIGIEGYELEKPKLEKLGLEKQELEPSKFRQYSTERIPGIKIKKLNVFANDQGYLFETLRNDDEMFDNKFGQVLVSEVYPGIIKGLHLHKKQTDYTTCIKGNLKYVAIKLNNDGTFIINTFTPGEKNPILIKCPPGIWHGYTPLSNQPATVLHLMDVAYNPEYPDTERKDPYEFGDFWTPKHG